MPLSSKSLTPSGTPACPIALSRLKLLPHVVTVKMLAIDRVHFTFYFLACPFTYPPIWLGTLAWLVIIAVPASA
jgi:hypothetical protein